jgi:uncharacterized protein YcfJ
MKTLVLSLCAVSTLAVSQLALAGPKHRHAYEDRRDRWEEPYDRVDTYEYGEVISAEPIYRTVRIEQPRRECWDERVVYDEGPRYSDNGAGGAILGAIIGGVAGHQFGGGRGKAAATAAGAVIGAGVGQRVATQNRRYEPRQERVGYEEVCETVTDYRTEQRVEAYDVSYRYGGRVYHTTLPHDPGSRIPVDVNVRPVRY